MITTQAPLLSRVADSIYWLSRYVERAQNLARFMDVNFHMTLDSPGEDDGARWGPLLSATAQREEFLAGHDAIDQKSVIEFLTFDAANPNSILRCLTAARDNARAVRDAISSEMWEQINSVHRFVRSEAFRGLYAGDPPGFFRRIKTEIHLLEGITDATMPHGEAWHFGRIGRLLERADKTSRILDVKYFILLPSVHDVGTPFDNLQWSALLKSVSGLEAYRKRHGRIDPEHVAEFLLLDREFPRSVLFCFQEAEESLRAITGSLPGTFRVGAEQLLGRLLARLSYLRIREIMSAGLHEFLDDLQREMNLVDDGIFDTFFALKPMSEVPGAPTRRRIERVEQ